MATKSIYKDVRIKDPSLCRRLVSALENAKSDKGKEVVFSKRVTTVKGEDINKMFSCD